MQNETLFEFDEDCFINPKHVIAIYPIRRDVGVWRFDVFAVGQTEPFVVEAEDESHLVTLRNKLLAQYQIVHQN